MKFGFIAKHRGIWPVRCLCEALGVSRSGFHGWLTRTPSTRTRTDALLTGKVRASFVALDRIYGARRVWHDVLADGDACGLHRIERLMRAEALRARPRRRGLPADAGVHGVDQLSIWMRPNGLGPGLITRSIRRQRYKLADDAVAQSDAISP